MTEKQSRSKHAFRSPDTPESLSDRVYRILKKDILRCALAPGSAVVESEVARSHSVSRTPVREALARLMQDGYLQTTATGGYIVTPITVKDVHEVYSLRLLLEPEATRLATSRISQEALDRLEKLLRDLQPMDLAGNDEERRLSYLETNTAFHMTIAKASGNERLAKIIGRLMEEASRYVFLESGIVGRRGIEESQAVFWALRDKDAKAASQHMKDHIDMTYQRTLEAVLSGIASVQL